MSNLEFGQFNSGGLDVHEPKMPPCHPGGQDSCITWRPIGRKGNYWSGLRLGDLGEPLGGDGNSKLNGCHGVVGIKEFVLAFCLFFWCWYISPCRVFIWPWYIHILSWLVGGQEMNVLLMWVEMAEQNRRGTPTLPRSELHKGSSGANGTPVHTSGTPVAQYFSDVCSGGRRNTGQKQMVGSLQSSVCYRSLTL